MLQDFALHILVSCMQFFTGERRITDIAFPGKDTDISFEVQSHDDRSLTDIHVSVNYNSRAY